MRLAGRQGRVMKQAGRGTIVNIASGAALRPVEQRTAYCTAKAGLVMFGKTLAVDLAAYHILGRTFH